jgi:hypothetical protein
VSTGDSKPSADSIRTRSACFFVIKGHLKMAVRAEDIVRNSEVSARVRAGPPARAVPRVTDALKSATFEPQYHDRPLGVDQRHSNPWAAIASAAARGYVRCFIVQFQKPGQVSRANPVYPNFRRMRRTLTLNPVFRSTAPQTPVPSSPGTRERFLRPVRAPGVAGAGIAGSSPVPGTSGRHRDGETGIPVRVREGFTACLAVLGRFSGPWRGLAGRPTSAWCYFAPRAAHRPFYR